MSKATTKGRGRAASEPNWLGWVLAPPTMDDLIRVLSAWRLWILGGLGAALLGAAAFALLPPPYRARATVNVDFHLEKAWPQNTDREQFYYLERETRKLVEVALSDTVLGAVTHEMSGITLQELRSGAAVLSQPGNGGWHFYGIDQNPRRASMIATSWAKAFRDEVAAQVSQDAAGGLESHITADLTQSAAPGPARSVTMGAYMLASTVGLLTIAALALLLFHPRR